MLLLNSWRNSSILADILENLDQANKDFVKSKMDIVVFSIKIASVRQLTEIL